MTKVITRNDPVARMREVAPAIAETVSTFEALEAAEARVKDAASEPWHARVIGSDIRRALYPGNSIYDLSFREIGNQLTGGKLQQIIDTVYPDASNRYRVSQALGVYLAAAELVRLYKTPVYAGVAWQDFVKQAAKQIAEGSRTAQSKIMERREREKSGLRKFFRELDPSEAAEDKWRKEQRPLLLQSVYSKYAPYAIGLLSSLSKHHQQQQLGEAEIDYGQIGVQAGLQALSAVPGGDITAGLIATVFSGLDARIAAKLRSKFQREWNPVVQSILDAGKVIEGWAESRGIEISNAPSDVVRGYLNKAQNPGDALINLASILTKIADQVQTGVIDNVWEQTLDKSGEVTEQAVTKIVGITGHNAAAIAQTINKILSGETLNDREKLIAADAARALREQHKVADFLVTSDEIVANPEKARKMELIGLAAWAAQFIL